MGKIRQNPKIGQLWRPVAPQPYVAQKSCPGLGNSHGPWTTMRSKQYLSAVHPVTCSLLWVRYLFWPTCDFRFWGQWPLKWKFSKMSSRIHRRDTQLRFVAKFGENRPLQSWWKVVWITTQNNSGSAGLVPAPILPKMGRSRPKFPERCHLLTSPRIPNFVRIGCAAGLISERLIFRAEK